MADMIDSMRVTSIREVLRARECSFSSISGLTMGAMLLGEGGTIYRRCNIERAGLTPNSCAEWTAFSKTVNGGCLKFRVTATVGGSRGRPLAGYYPPCSACHQLMVQFCSLDTFKTIMAVNEADWKECVLGESPPMVFQRLSPNV